MREAPATKSQNDMLAVIALHLVLVRPVFQLNDHDMTLLLPPFSWHFGCIYTLKNAQGWLNVAGGQVGSHRPPSTP